MKSVWAAFKGIGSFIRNIGTFTLGILVIFSVLSILIAQGTQQAPTVPKGAVLILWPEGQIVEQIEQPDTLELIFSKYNSKPPQTSIHDITTALSRAAQDDRIAALAIMTDNMGGAAPSHLHTIAAAIRDFKTTGKKVFAISSAYSQSDYLIAAEADKIYMNPYGNVLLSGYGQYPAYFKDLLDKIGATINVFRVGTYKSAVEPYIRNDMSDAAREANMDFLGSLWQQYTASVETARGMEAGTLNQNIARISTHLRDAGGDFAKLAQNEGLVDELAPRAHWRQALSEEFGSMAGGTSFEQILYTNYLAATNNQPRSNREIAVITAQGPIVMGDGPITVAAAETVVSQIRNARTNPRTAAIVLRVNSPGGSTFASELIRQELATAQAEGIKVIASMGPVAASGGYWISATADEIWAAPSTITGSIGIFGLIPTYENTLQKIGVRTDGVGTTPLAGSFDLTRPLSDLTKDIIQQNIEAGYGQFLDLVARGRNMTTEDVDKIAQGRVWVGTKAKELGLVDHLGEFDDAVKAAATAAGVENNYSAVFYRKNIDPFEQMLASLFGSSIRSELGDWMQGNTSSPLINTALKVKQEAEFLMTLNDPAARYVVCLECTVQ